MPLIGNEGKKIPNSISRVLRNKSKGGCQCLSVSGSIREVGEKG